MKKNILVAFLSCLIALTACKTSELGQTAPEKYDSKAFAEVGFGTVCVLPYDLFRARTDGKNIPHSEILEKRLRNFLQNKGYKVIENDVVESVIAEEMEEIGGLYDSITGEIDKATTDRFVRRCIDALSSDYSSEIFLFPGYEVERVKMDSERKINWAGVSRELERLEDHPTVYNRNVRVLTLTMTVYNENYEVILSNQSGLTIVDKQVFRKYASGLGSLSYYIKENFFENGSEVSEAISNSLRPWIN